MFAFIVTCLLYWGLCRWNRARLLEKTDDGWEVFFLDYGERQVVEESDVRRLPNQFCQLPGQAVECGLAHIQPTGSVTGYLDVEKVL